MKQLVFIAVLLLSLFFVGPAFGKEFKGKVIGITDGDTVKVLNNNTVYKIRLRGIDCPEKKQPFGKQAKLFTSQLAFDKDVIVIESGHDRYGRLIADLVLPDHTYISRDIVRAGYAWWYRQYAPKDKVLAYAEADAKLDGLGIWSANNSEPPWQFRRKQKQENKFHNQRDLGKLSQLERAAQ